MTKTVFALLLFFSCCQLKAQPSDTLYLPKDTVYELDAVEISAVRDNSIMSGTMSGRIDLKAENLQSLPKFLGTTDMLRTIQLTPGIQTSGELDAGLYIRGCESGHNQVMFNDVPIYNPMHLMGFFSIFNSDHISSSSIYKSYISPQYRRTPVGNSLCVKQVGAGRAYIRKRNRRDTLFAGYAGNSRQ